MFLMNISSKGKKKSHSSPYWKIYNFSFSGEFFRDSIILYYYYRILLLQNIVYFSTIFLISFLLYRLSFFLKILSYLFLRFPRLFPDEGNEIPVCISSPYWWSSIHHNFLPYAFIILSPTHTLHFVSLFLEKKVPIVTFSYSSKYYTTTLSIEKLFTKCNKESYDRLFITSSAS